MGQQTEFKDELKKAILSHDDMLIEVFLQTMIDEGMINLDMITNPYAKSKDGRILIDIDKKREDYIKIICPFHETDNDGSGRLNLEDQYYKCFNGDCVANKPMNVIDLYMVLKMGVDPKLLSTEDVTKNEFKQAMRELADFLGISYSSNKREYSEEEKEAFLIRKIREEFAEIYHQAIFQHKYAKNAVEYMLKERGFMYGIVPFETLVKQFKMGWAPGWSYAYDKVKHKYSKDILLKAGVIREYTNKQKKKQIGDFLSGGVVLPYFSKGKINNLYARSLFAKDKNYRHLRLNGNVDIPINFDEAKKHKELIIVEGEFSWLSLVSLGFINTIGNRGTNGLSDKHVSYLKSVRDQTGGDKCFTIYLCFDPDKAGQGAIEKTGKKLLDEGFDVRVILMKDGDPNDFLQLHKNQAKAEFLKLYKNAVSYDAFMITHLLRKAALKKESSDAEVLASLKSIEPYVKKTPKLQLAIIANEVVTLLAHPLITIELLQHIWLDIPMSVKPQNLGFDQALRYIWMFLTDSKERYDLLVKYAKFNNVVWIQDRDKFIHDVKKYPHVNSLLIDSAMDKETIHLLSQQLEGFKFSLFDCPSDDKLSTASHDELNDMVKTFQPSAQKVM